MNRRDPTDGGSAGDAGAEGARPSVGGPRLSLVGDTGQARAFDGGLDIDAFVDGALGAGAHAAVERRLAGDPDEAARAAAYRAQIEGLHALYDSVLAEDIPPRIMAALTKERSRRGRQLVLAASAVVAGLLGGGLTVHQALDAAGKPAGVAESSIRS
ncbi:MAG TPA: hypothetical protein VED40_13890 [Azospirillaceae bacterium]|nr:hypothetical protein [Azospirillaceae bacterium]